MILGMRQGDCNNAFAALLFAACRSRVVSIKAPERSYHIFYQLCAGASEDQREELG
jgi:hypothetical protein